MPNYRAKALFFAAALTGALHAFVASLLWGSLATQNPIFDSLLDTFARIGHDAAYRVAVYSIELIINVLLAIPFAILIANFIPRRSWSYLWVAVAVSFCLWNWSLFMNPAHLAVVLAIPSFYLGTFVMALSLPLAFAVVVRSEWIANAT